MSVYQQAWLGRWVSFLAGWWVLTLSGWFSHVQVASFEMGTLFPPFWLKIQGNSVPNFRVADRFP